MLTEADHLLLDSPVFAKLATLMPNGWPQLSVMWFRREGEVFHMITHETYRKARNLERDPRATLVVEYPDNPYRYLEMRCSVEISHDDAAARVELRRIAERYLGDRADAYMATVAAEPCVLITLTPVRVRRYPT